MTNSTGVGEAPAPTRWLRRMSGWFSGPGVGVLAAPREVRLLVAQSNGVLRTIHQSRAALPENALEPSLRAPNVTDSEAVSGVLASLIEEARGAGLLPRQPRLVTLLIPDASVRVAVKRVEGAAPRRSEGEEMALWALRDSLPVDPDLARIDWTFFPENDHGWLLAIGAEAAVVREYESMLEAFGWTVGRVTSCTMALAAAFDPSKSSGSVAVADAGLRGAQEVESAGDGEAEGGYSGQRDPEVATPGVRLFLNDLGGSLACLVEAAWVPRFYRVWRGEVLPGQLADELVPLQQYLQTRLELDVDEAVLSGSEDWRAAASEVCASLGWRAQELSPWAALLGAMKE